jgi:hypothetical protein
MDIVTKVFLVNVLLLVIVTVVDTFLPENFFANYYQNELRIWIIISNLSIPAWLIYIIVTW